MSDITSVICCMGTLSICIMHRDTYRPQLFPSSACADTARKSLNLKDAKVKD